VELEEQSIERLPERCENCGTELTEKEKATALEEGASVVLCTTCAAEAEPMPDEPEEFEA
jgi:hypothetical protein